MRCHGHRRQYGGRTLYTGGGGYGNELAETPSRTTRGAGFRYLVARRYGFETGLDIARGPEDTVFYIQAGSARR